MEKKELDVSHRVNSQNGGSLSKVLDEVTGKKGVDNISQKADVSNSPTTKSIPTKLTPSFIQAAKQPFNAAHFTTGRASASLTSTAV